MAAPSSAVAPLTPGLLASLAAACFAAAAAMHFQSPMLGAMALDFGVDAAAAGWVATLTFAGYFGAMVFIVPLGDRLDKRKLLLGQLAGLLVSTLAMALAPSLAAAAAASLVLGLCACLSQTVFPVIVELSPPSGRGRLVGTLFTALFLGILFGRMAGGVIAAHLGWRWSYVLSELLLCVVTVVLALRLPRIPPRTSMSYAALLASVALLLKSDAELRRICAIQFFLGICYGGFWATLAPMLAALHRLGPAEAGWMALPGASGALIARPAGHWMDRRGVYPVVTTGACLVLAGFVIMEFAAATILAVIAGAVLLDCGLRAAMVANQTHITASAAETRSRVNTVFGAHVWGGNAIGAFIMSIALAHWGWTAACSLAASSAAIALGLQLVRRR